MTRVQMRTELHNKRWTDLFDNSAVYISGGSTRRLLQMVKHHGFAQDSLLFTEALEVEIHA
ncbi:hypothetical protein [Halobacillus karajensis]|uniref:hypothetical protein n=1 Tax=Halobacillus karajensis TaxID=195088 RepID=UPI0012DC9FCC|nr:hypothetical protein [Halobacillus karajensis]